MNKRIARALATTALAAAIVAVPAAGSAVASSAHSTRGSEQFYNHEVQASTSHVSYSASTTYYASSDCYGNEYGYGRGILGLLGLKYRGTFPGSPPEEAGPHLSSRSPALCAPAPPDKPAARTPLLRHPHDRGPVTTCPFTRSTYTRPRLRPVPICGRARREARPRGAPYDGGRE
ncbi:hypothetical protein [Kitasatospora sp. MBT63]|uniref:hypothetical protein n=1 Tax=Kitasatospora sp. MBT63 TaxID=1444768 RepID=UPI00053AD788|nr:hypothetical protein [Kitasatospora sp. MBT63]